MSLVSFMATPPGSVQGELNPTEKVQAAVVYAASSSTIIAILNVVMMFASWFQSQSVGMPPWVTVVAGFVAGIVPLAIQLVHSLFDGKPAPTPSK